MVSVSRGVWLAGLLACELGSSDLLCTYISSISYPISGSTCRLSRPSTARMGKQVTAALRLASLLGARVPLLFWPVRLPNRSAR
ncbi:hypothetical protein GGR52DRAFT_533129 [Hypoxylon sp. FL1284]|nr:hypothetical protein GGR52DRAFT_533129 [Hypoxylon sp. FL1284]